MAEYFGRDIGKLGFGLMRLPRKGIKFDADQIKTMVDMYLEAGFNYFDTAFIYPGSEAVTKKTLIDRHNREDYCLATKVNASFALTKKAAMKQIETSLKRLGTDYIDFYLLHSITGGNEERYEKFGLWDFVDELKAKGMIKHYGFSYHADPVLLDKILTEHPEAEFVQLQINYADWEDKKISSRANYEVARKHGKPVVIMEPVKGGSLANPPKDVRKLMDAANPGASYASWALRFAASLDGVLTVLSGMSNIQQMSDNLSFMKDFKPLSEAELDIIRQAREILGKSNNIPCTACSYCTSGCPKGIPIPDIFAAENLRLESGQKSKAMQMYEEAVKDAGRAGDCVACHACEKVCPQHIEIVDTLKRCAGEFDAD